MWKAEYRSRQLVYRGKYYLPVVLKSLDESVPPISGGITFINTDESKDTHVLTSNGITNDDDNVIYRGKEYELLYRTCVSNNGKIEFMTIPEIRNAIFDYGNSKPFGFDGFLANDNHMTTFTFHRKHQDVIWVSWHENGIKKWKTISRPKETHLSRFGSVSNRYDVCKLQNIDKHIQPSFADPITNGEFRKVTISSIYIPLRVILGDSFLQKQVLFVEETNV